MANPEHVEIVKQGADAIREWREKNADLRLDLRGADLIRADLIEADLSRADLIRADLLGADLLGADLSGANLSAANLREANLSEANLRRADLSETDLEKARIGLTSFGDLDLSSVKGLEGVNHVASSTIGVDTLYKSQGKIPVSFLRGCGVPDSLIDYLPSLLDAQEPKK
jgi:uncharacterized protein YjbI with pentapeptide repeats